MRSFSSLISFSSTMNFTKSFLELSQNAMCSVSALAMRSSACLCRLEFADRDHTWLRLAFQFLLHLESGCASRSARDDASARSQSSSPAPLPPLNFAASGAYSRTFAAAEREAGQATRRQRDLPDPLPRSLHAAVLRSPLERQVVVDVFERPRINCIEAAP
jgi:hypothetical protein